MLKMILQKSNIPIQKVKFIFLLVSISFIIISCGVYSFTGASISPEIKTISIARFPNNASLVEPTLSQKFTEALKDKFVSETNLTLVNKGGDLRIDGEIVNYSVLPVAIQANETAALNRLTIIVKVKYINTFDESKDFESKFSRFEEYPSSENLANVQETLINQINSMLVEDIFNKAVVNW
jgi:hypothetical protein